MKKWCLALLAGMCGAAIVLAACGGGGDDDNDGDATATRNPRTANAAAGRTGTPGASSTDAAGTPGAEGTSGASGETPAPGSTLAPGQTPVPGTTPGANATNATGGPDPSTPPTPTSVEIDATTGVDDTLIGGDPSADPEVVTDLPQRPDDASTDPATIAPPNVSGSGFEFIVDANASEPGIQSSRTVQVGDVFRVGVVLANIPSEGMSAFNFSLEYDLTKAVAPTIINGSSLARNPDINEEGLGGSAAGWLCTPPAPEGDADEPGLFNGDGDPATGQALISCYTPGAYPVTGTVVLAVVEFQAVAGGTFEIALSETPENDTSAFNPSFTSMATCADELANRVPCRSISITVD